MTDRFSVASASLATVVVSSVVCFITLQCNTKTIPERIERERVTQETEQLRLQEYSKCLDKYEMDECYRFYYDPYSKQALAESLYTECMSYTRSNGGCNQNKPNPGSCKSMVIELQ